MLHMRVRITKRGGLGIAPEISPGLLQLRQLHAGFPQFRSHHPQLRLEGLHLSLAAAPLEALALRFLTHQRPGRGFPATIARVRPVTLSQALAWN